MTPQPTMTPADALATIDQALATISTNRQGHIALQQCIAVLSQAIADAKGTTEAILSLENERAKWQQKAETLKSELQQQQDVPDGPINAQAAAGQHGSAEPLPAS